MNRPFYNFIVSALKNSCLISSLGPTLTRIVRQFQENDTVPICRQFAFFQHGNLPNSQSLTWCLSPFFLVKCGKYLHNLTLKSAALSLSFAKVCSNSAICISRLDFASTSWLNFSCNLENSSNFSVCCLKKMNII